MSEVGLISPSSRQGLVIKLANNNLLIVGIPENTSLRIKTASEEINIDVAFRFCAATHIKHLNPCAFL